MQHKNLNDHLAPPKMLSRTPKGCEHPWLGTPVLKTHLFELYPNVYIALRILLTCPVTVASAERSFSKLKLIKTFNRTSMTDSRLSSLAMLSIENDCARSLDYDNVITAFANKKVRSRLFK